MAELGLNPHQNEIIKESLSLVNKITRAEVLFSKDVERFIKVYKNIPSGRNATLTSGQRAIKLSGDQLKNMQPVFKSLFEMLVDIASDVELGEGKAENRATENSEELLKHFYKILRSKELTDLVKSFCNEANTHLRFKAGRALGSDGHNEAKAIRADVKNVVKTLRVLAVNCKEYIRLKKSKETKMVSMDRVKQKMSNLKSKMGFDSHDRTRDKLRKTGSALLGGALLFAGIFSKSAGVGLLGAGVLKKRQDKINKSREIHAKKLNAVHKMENQIQKALQDSKDAQEGSKKKNKLELGGFLAGGGAYRAKRNTSVVVGDNRGGRERVAISGSSPFTTKGATLLNLRAGQRIAARPLGGSGVTRVNKGALSRFAGGTDVESDKEQISNPQAIANPIVAAIKTLTAVISLNAKDQADRDADAANKDKGIGASKFGAGRGLIEHKDAATAGAAGGGGLLDMLMNRFLPKGAVSSGLAKGAVKLAGSRAGMLGAGALGAGAGAYGGYKLGKWVGDKAFGVSDEEEAQDRAENNGELSTNYKIRKGLATTGGVIGAGAGGYGGYKAGQFALGKAGAWGASKLAANAATGVAEAGAGGATAVSKMAPMLGNVGKVLGKLAVPLAGVVAGVSEYTDEKNATLDTGTKAGKAAFAGGGAMAGTALGATLGSVVPVVGTAIGGAIGGWLGGKAGSMIGNVMMDSIDEKTGEKKRGLLGKGRDMLFGSDEIDPETGKKKSGLLSKAASGIGGLLGFGRGKTGAIAKDGSALVTVTNAKEFAKAQSEVKKDDISGDKKEGIEGFFDKLANSDNPLLKALGIGGGLATTGIKTVATGISQGASGAMESYRAARGGGGSFVESATAALKGGYSAARGKAKEREDQLEKAAIASGMTDPKELAMFMGQAKHETAGFGTMREYASGKAYEGRKDLGNTQQGDGERFRGRGYFQLTGRANYADMSKKLGMDLVTNPELAEDPAIAAKIALQYWKDKGLDKASKAGDFDKVTKRINGGTNGYEDRLKQTQGYNTKYANGVGGNVAVATNDKAGLPAAVAGSIPPGETAATMAMTAEQRFAAGLPPLKSAVQYAEAKSPSSNVPVPSTPSKATTAQGEIRVAQAQSKAGKQEKAARERAAQEAMVKTANATSNVNINSSSSGGKSGGGSTKVTTGDDSMISMYNLQLGMV